MERKPPRPRNPYLRPGTVPETCPSIGCGESLQLHAVTEKTEKEIAFRLKCPECGALFDQACPTCGSKEVQTVDGVEECVRCGNVLQVGRTPANSNTQ